MVVLVNSADGGTDGVTVTTGNSGGASGDAWDRITRTDATATCAYDAAQSAHGGMSIRQATGAIASETNMRWDISVGTLERCTGRCYFRMAAVGVDPPGTRHLVRFKGAGSLTARFQVKSTASIELRNGANSIVATSDLEVVANEWYRVEWDIVPGVGQYSQLAIFASPDSLTPDEVIGATSDYGTQIDYVEFGQFTQHIGIPDLWFDDLMAASELYPGPVEQDTPFVNGPT